MTPLGRGERGNKMDRTHTRGEADAYQKYYSECSKPDLRAYSVQDCSLSMEAFPWLPVVGGSGEGTDKGEDFAGKMFCLDCGVILNHTLWDCPLRELTNKHWSFSLKIHFLSSI